MELGRVAGDIRRVSHWGKVWDTQAEFDQGFLMMGFGNEVRMIQVKQYSKGEPGGAEVGQR